MPGARPGRASAALFPFMRIAVDVMGGDHGSGIVIDGVKQALAAYPQISELYLVGQQKEIEGALQAAGCNDARLRVGRFLHP